MRFAVRLLFLALLLGSLGPGEARADSDRERARRHVESGDKFKRQAEEHVESGDRRRAVRSFRKAAAKYQAAYDLVPHPLMLYNLAQVYRLAGDKQQALDLYYDFLDSNPTGEAATFARKYIKILERTLARSEQRETDDDDDDDLDSDDFDDDDDDLTDETVADATKGGDEGSAGQGLRYAGLGLAATGLVSIAVGVKFGLDAQSIASCLTNYPASCDEQFPPGQWTDEALLLEQEGKDAEFKMLLFTSVGAAVIIGGGALYYLGEQKRADSADEQALSVRPSVGEQQLGLVFSGRF